MHIARLDSGLWRVQVRHAGRRRSATAKTKAEAREVGHLLERELRGVWSDERPTVGQLVERRLTTADWAPVTVDVYGRAAKRLPPSISTLRADKARPVDFEDLYRSLTAEGLDADSVRHLHSLLGQAFDDAVRLGVVETNPVRAANRPKGKRRPITVPTPEQVAAIIAAAGSSSARVALRLAATTGMRRGEVVALRWSALDLDRPADHLSVTTSMASTPAAGVHERPTKTGESGHRVITLDALTIAELRRHRAEQIELLMAFGHPGTPDWLISDDGGVTHWRPDRFTREFSIARKKAGVEGVRLHDLRHFAATQLLAAGIPVGQVAHRLGHSDTSTTERVYRHWIPGLDAQAAEVMGRLLG